MIRKIAALIAGLITSFIVVSLVQVLNGLIFGMMDPNSLGDIEKMRAFVAGMSAGAFIGLLLSYVLGSVAAGVVMRFISRSSSIVLPMAVGVVGTVTWIYNVTNIPHPTWVMIAGFFCFVPFVLLGHRLASGATGR